MSSPKKLVRLFLVCLFSLILIKNLYAQDVLERSKILFLQHQYWQTIQECATVIHDYPRSSELSCEANYFTAASYVNLFDFLTAKKNFKVIIDKYPGSSYYEDAYLALGEVEFLLENFKEALRVYTEFYNTNPSKKRLATLYFRLAEVNLKLGDKSEYKKYLDKLKTEFPRAFEARDAVRLADSDSFYTVQVGAFTNYANAEKFITDLKAKGYEVYSVLCLLADKKLCRIRIGRFKTSQEAENLKKKLETEGYFVKVFPFE